VERIPVCRSEDSVLLIVDIQERLTAAMAPAAREIVFRNTGILSQTAERLGIPVMLSEQYPKGLGYTEAEVFQRLGQGAQRFEKTSFSCCGAGELMAALRQAGRHQVVLAGMEAHVCVLQTALGLHSDGFEIYVVEDATCSRSPANRQNALQRLRQAGVVVTNTESVVFEWLKDSRHEHFRAISALLR
jgi:nicotinamidase-related amidase